MGPEQRCADDSGCEPGAVVHQSVLGPELIVMSNVEEEPEPEVDLEGDTEWEEVEVGS